MSMQIRAYVMQGFPQFAPDLVDIGILMQEVDEQTQMPSRTVAILHRQDDGFYTWRQKTDAERAGAIEDDPQLREVLRLPSEAAEALARALSRHFNGPQADAAVYRDMLHHEKELREVAEAQIASMATELLRKVTKQPDITEQGQALMKLADAVVISEQGVRRGYEDRDLHFHPPTACRGHMIVDFFPTCTYEGGNT